MGPRGGLWRTLNQPTTRKSKYYCASCELMADCDADLLLTLNQRAQNVRTVSATRMRSSISVRAAFKATPL